MQWYYVKGEQQHGPVDEAELFAMARDGRLAPTDLVWNESMGEQWVEASTVPGVFDKGAPPPLPPETGELRAEAQAGAGADVLSRRISCTAPVGIAWRRMVQILFRPFNLGHWFALGFSAWLATLGQGRGGGSYKYKSSESGDWEAFKEQAGEEQIEQLIEVVRGFLEQYRSVIVGSVTVGAIVIVVVGLLILWVRSRGKFMFLDNIVHDSAEISEPWRTFAQHGNSLFRWCIVYRIITLVLFLPILAIIFAGVIMPCFRIRGYDPSVMSSIFMAGALWLLYVVVLAYVSRFLEDFVIPFMYNMDLTAMEAWGRFMRLLKQCFGKFLLYGLFYAILAIVAGTALVALMVVTCCIAGCLMGLPYVGAVVVLPVTVFFRLYSLEYLAQFGPQYVMKMEE